MFSVMSGHGRWRRHDLWSFPWRKLSHQAANPDSSQGPFADTAHSPSVHAVPQDWLLSLPRMLQSKDEVPSMLWPWD